MLSAECLHSLGFGLASYRKGAAREPSGTSAEPATDGTDAPALSQAAGSVRSRLRWFPPQGGFPLSPRNREKRENRETARGEGGSPRTQRNERGTSNRRHEELPPDATALSQAAGSARSPLLQHTAAHYCSILQPILQLILHTAAYCSPYCSPLLQPITAAPITAAPIPAARSCSTHYCSPFRQHPLLQPVPAAPIAAARSCRAVPTVY